MTNGKLIRHFAIHRIKDVELRVISDIEDGVIAITEIESDVLGQYVGLPGWPHSVVSLFVLSDLGPLQRQLTSRAGLPPGGVEALAHRPVVNIYDLAHPGACHIFVNQAIMGKEGYWSDRQAVTGLLAHEHAHPLAENDATAASRRLGLKLALGVAEPLNSVPGDGNWEAKMLRLLEVLSDKLVAYAPREVFTNDLVLRVGFAEALHHLDLINVLHAAAGVLARPSLIDSLAAERGLTPVGRQAFLLVADLKAHLDLAVETASFMRQGRSELQAGLEAGLMRDVFPHLAPQVAPAYLALRRLYGTLQPEMTQEDMMRYAGEAMKVLGDALAPCGIRLTARIMVKS